MFNTYKICLWVCWTFLLPLVETAYTLYLHMHIFYSFTISRHTLFALAETLSLTFYSSSITRFNLSCLATHSLSYTNIHFVELFQIYQYLFYIFVTHNHTLPYLPYKSLLFAFIFPIFIPMFSYSTLSYCFPFILRYHILLNSTIPVHTSSSTLSYLSLGIPIT